MKGIESISERFLVDLSRLEKRNARAQQQLSSGLRVARSSDAPDSVKDIVDLRSQLSRSTALRTNYNRATAEVDSGEAALRVAVSLLERARTLAAANAGDTAVNRSAAAIEVRQLHEQLVSLTRTSTEGRIVFSGDLDGTALYSSNWTAPGGIVRLAQAQNTRVIEDVAGSRFSLSRSAHEIFDARNSDDTFAAGNAFNAIYSLGRALENNSADDVQSATQLLNDAFDHMGRQLTFYGVVQNRVRDAIDLNQKAALAYASELSAAQDADITAATLELNATLLHQQTALAAHGKLPRQTLFDYLG